MKQNYYLLAALLSNIWMFPVYVYAKSVNSHPVKSSKITQNKSDTSVSETQNEGVLSSKINKILFSGNTVISSQLLTKAIPLKVNDIANEYVIMDSIVKIAQIYKAKNIKVTITPVLEKVSTNSRNIRFDIHETSISKN